MVLIIPIRDSNAYIGWAKQAVGGTAVAPSAFFWWQDGSNIQFDLKASAVKESDSSRRTSQMIKNGQSCKIKVVTAARPIMLGMAEEAAMGATSDSITAGTPSGTLNTALTANSSTSISVTGAGFSVFATPASGTLYLAITDPTNGNEIIPCTLPATGAGPYAFTIAASYNSGKPKLSHAGSNVLTVAVLTSVNTSLTSAASKGATTFAVGNNSNMTGSGTQVLVLSPGTASEEVVTVTTPATSGAGPWTFTITNSGTLKNAHSSGDLVYSPVLHTMTDQNDGDYFTIEVGLGSLYSGAGMTLRVRDCKVDQIVRSSKAGELLLYEIDYIGTVTVAQGSPSVVTLDTSHVPFLFTQGTWTIDGSGSGDALAIEDLKITQKNMLDVVQTEALTPAAIIFGQVDIALDYTCVFTSNSKLFAIFFGSSAGTTDSQTMFTGSLVLVFTQADGFHSVTYTINTIAYPKGTIPTPKTDGKHFTQAISGTATSNYGTNAYLMQALVGNTQNSQY